MVSLNMNMGLSAVSCRRTRAEGHRGEDAVLPEAERGVPGNYGREVAGGRAAGGARAGAAARFEHVDGHLEVLFRKA